MTELEGPRTTEAAVGECSVFRGLSEAARTALGRHAKRMAFTAGSVVVTETGPAPWVLLVVNGLLRGSVGSNGAEEVIDHAGPGAVVGGSLLTGKLEAIAWTAERAVVALAWDEAAIREVERQCSGSRAGLVTAVSIRERTRELVSAIRQSALFRQTSPVIITELVRRSTLVGVKSGDFVFRQGDPGDAFYVVLRGEIEIARQATQPSESEAVAVLYSGDAFGEMALLSGAPRNATARALRDAELLLVTSSDFEDLLRSCAAFQRGLDAVLRMRTGSVERRPQRVELFWFFNRTSCPTHEFLTTLKEEMAALGDRVAVLHFRGSQAAGLGRDGALETALEVLCRERPLDYVLCYVSPEHEDLLGAELGQRARRTIVLTEDASLPAPRAIAEQEGLSWVEIRGPSWSKPPSSRFRRGTIPMPLPVTPETLARNTEPTPAVRAEFARLARALTDRTVGLALGGGAAWGFAHIALIRGVLRAGVPIDMIAGTSVGSIVGAVYASAGLGGLDALVAARRELALRAAACVVSSRPVTGFMKPLLAHEHLEELPIPFFPVAVDIDAGRERVFRHGSIAQAVRASCSLPGIFGPSDYEGHRYVDGCVMFNVPVEAVIEEGADFVVASNIIPAPGPSGERRARTALGRTLGEFSFRGRVRDSFRALFLLYNVTGHRQASAANVTFSPDLNPYYPTDFVRAPEIISRAEEQLSPVISEIGEKFAAFCRRSPGP